MENKIPGVINYMKYWWVYALISSLVIIPGTVSLIRNGLKPSIDFTGGTLLEIALPPGSPITKDIIEQSTPDGIAISSLQVTGANTYLIRMKPITKDQNEQFKEQIASRSGLITASVSAKLAVGQNLKELRFETVGPILGQELLNKTYIAVILASLLILAYVAYRFNELKYGVSAILAMFHDTLVLIGVFSLLGYFAHVEVDTLFVTAVLTTLSFSVHDTIVVYDRIRESKRKFPSVNQVTLINKSVTETMTRSINNSMTIIFMLLALLMFGGVTIKWFVLALLIGTITGTYSSPFVAGPLLVAWDKIFKRKK
jgi:preprotein translocase subunit SecF